MIRTLATAALALAALTGCPGQQSSPTTTAAAARPSTQELVADQKRRLAGSYQCKLEFGDTVIEGPCAIEAAGAGFRMVMQGGARLLAGQVEATDAGFHLAGELACPTEAEPAPDAKAKKGKKGKKASETLTVPECPDPVDTDFFEQSEGVYSGVFALESDGAIANATLTRR